MVVVEVVVEWESVVVAVVVEWESVGQCHSHTLEEVSTTEAPHIILYTTIAPLRVSQIDLIVSELNEM
jgi:hypothetical protein